MLSMTARPTSMPFSRNIHADPLSLGWPVDEKPEVPEATTYPQISAALNAAGSTELILQKCRESLQSTNAFCLSFTYEDPSEDYGLKGWGPPPETPTPRPFSIEHVDGYGISMVANKEIQTGETILLERPIIIYPSIINETFPKLHWIVMEVMLQAAFPLLGETERSLYVELWNCKPLTGSLGNKLLGIATTNGLYTSSAHSNHLFRHAGVFPNISRCNHSCGPNASARFNEETMTMRLFSRRPIAPGEQITLNYVVGTMPCARRQEELKTKYLFTCECPCCKPMIPSRPSRPLQHPYWNIVNQTTNEHVDLSAEINASDIRRSQLAFRLDHAEKLWVEWLSPSSKQSEEDLVQFHEDALVIIDQEGLQLMRGRHFAYLAHACAALEDEGGFRRWGSALMSLSDWTEGRKGIEQKKTWQDWIRDPMASPAWGLRTKAKGNAQCIPRA